MAFQNSQANGSAVPTGPQQNIGQGQNRPKPKMPDYTAIQIIPPEAFDENIETSRFKTKWVARCDLCCGCCFLTLVILLGLFILLLRAAARSVGISSRPRTIGERTTTAFAYTELAIGALYTIFEIIAAVSLLIATRPNTPPVRAYQKASCWQLTSVLFVFFNLNFGLFCIAFHFYHDAGISFAFFFFRILLIFLANRFIKGMENRASAEPEPDPTTLNMENTNMGYQPMKPQQYQQQQYQQQQYQQQQYQQQNV